MKVRDIMTTGVVTVPAAMPLYEVAAVLRSHRISAVPVLDGAGAVVGLVSENDLLSRSGATAADVMTTAVVSVTPDTEAEDVRHLLVERRIRRVPVMAGHDLVGIISRADVVGMLAAEWACEVCGTVSRGRPAPVHCPVCGGTADRLAPHEPYPGS